MSCRYLLIPLILLLSACAGQGGGSAALQIEPPAKPGGRLCAFQCRAAFDHCADGCKLEQRACTNEMQAQAIADYEGYAREQFLSHKQMELRPRDFERPETCVPNLCRSACRVAYKNCFEGCGGKVTGWSETTPFPFER